MQNPTDLTDDALNDASMADVLANSAEGLFVNAYARGIGAGELPGDGLISSGTQTEYQRLDQGLFDVTSSRRDFALDDVYNALSQARWTAAEAERRLEKLLSSPDTDIRMARAHFYDAMSRIVLADLWEAVTFDGGAPVQPADVYRSAIEHLSIAHEIATAAQDTRYQAASLGARARARHALYVETEDAAALAEAATDARAALGVSPRFQLDARFQMPGSENLLYANMNRGQLVVAIGMEYVRRKDPATGVLDPRVKHSGFVAKAANGQDSIFFQLKYPNADSDIPVVKWQEMNLIVAEHELSGGNVQLALEALNSNRRAVGLADLATADAAQAREWLISERAAELWLEGRRWADMRRFGALPESHWIAAAIAQGVDRKFPIPISERSTNPNVQ